MRHLAGEYQQNSEWKDRNCKARRTASQRLSATYDGILLSRSHLAWISLWGIHQRQWGRRRLSRGRFFLPTGDTVRFVGEPRKRGPLVLRTPRDPCGRRALRLARRGVHHGHSAYRITQSHSSPSSRSPRKSRWRIMTEVSRSLLHHYFG